MTVQKDNSRITIRAMVAGAIFSGIFAALTVYFSNVKAVYASASQIPVLPYILLCVTALLINPICRLVRFIRPFSPAEILIVFVMGMVSAGVSTFGLSAQIVPVIGNLMNEHWNNAQSEWNRSLDPNMDDSFFLSVPGVQAASRAYAEAVDRRDAETAVLNAMLAHAKARDRVDQAQRSLDAAQAEPGTAAEREMAITRAQTVLRSARESMAASDQLLETLRADRPELRTQDEASVMAEYRERIAGLDQTVTARRNDLAVLESQAFERARLFRRGLPIGQRAYPGIIPVGDSWKSYTARFRRFRVGRSALGDLREVQTSWADTPRAIVLLESAARKLSRLADGEDLARSAVTLNAELDRLTAESVKVANQLEAKNAENRFADLERRQELTRDIDKLTNVKRKVELSRAKAEAKLAAVKTEQAAVMHAGEAADGLKVMIATLSSGGWTAEERDRRLQSLIDLFPSFDASVRRFFLGDVPWGHWTSALVSWGLLVALTYTVLMAFNLLIFRQWAHHEKLSFPLATLPEELAGMGSTRLGAIPSVFSNGLFWVGFAISGTVLGWNLLVATGWIPGLKGIDLLNLWNPYIVNSPLKALSGTTKSMIFFTMIGLSFLTPQKISFSLWFFSVFYMVQLIVLVQLGYGVNEGSFPSDWCYTMNFRYAQGGGALMVFSLVVLFKCRRYILCFFRPNSLSDLDPAERTELRISSFLFIFGSLGIMATLWLGMGAHPGYTVFVYVFILLITIGMIRAVAEGGILGFQAPSGPFHMIRAFLGMRKDWVAPAFFAPLMVYYSVFFFDLKTFIAPAMANGIKIRDDLKMSRVRFHVSIVIGLLIAVAVGVGLEIAMSYVPGRGADNMELWFHTIFPKTLYEQVAAMVEVPPGPAPAEGRWVLAGAGMMTALLFFRQRCFWLPHPLGLIMLINPIMRAYWFSVLLGWAAKSLVTKYGNKDTYARVKGGFIGLIAGELLIVTLSLILTIVLAKPLGIDLNRNW